MQIPVQQFPVLTPGQMSPYHQAVASGLENFGNILKTAYTPATMLAEIASKQAYAKNLNKQILATVLGNPAAVSLMEENQFKNLLGQLMAPDENQPSATTSTNQTKGLWDTLMEKVGLTTPSQPTTAPISPTAAPSAVGGGTEFGKVNEAPPEMVEDIANHGNLAYQGQGNVPYGTSAATPAAGSSDRFKMIQNALIAKNLPASPQGLAAEKSRKEIEAQNELWKERKKDLGKNVDATQSSLTSLDAMKKLYDQLPWYEKGTGFGSAFGTGYAGSSTAQSFDQLAQGQSTANLRALQTGHITNTDFAIGERLKPGRWMNKDAFNTMVNYNKALALRSKQKQRFMNDANSKGMSLEDADQMWSNFIEQHPIFDSNTGVLNENNYKISPFSVSDNVGTVMQRAEENNSATKMNTSMPQGETNSAAPTSGNRKRYKWNQQTRRIE